MKKKKSKKNGDTEDLKGSYEGWVSKTYRIVTSNFRKEGLYKNRTKGLTEFGDEVDKGVSPEGTWVEEVWKIGNGTKNLFWIMMNYNILYKQVVRGRGFLYIDTPLSGKMSNDIWIMDLATDSEFVNNWITFLLERRYEVKEEKSVYSKRHIDTSTGFIKVTVYLVMMYVSSSNISSSRNRNQKKHCYYGF